MTVCPFSKNTHLILQFFLASLKRSLNSKLRFRGTRLCKIAFEAELRDGVQWCQFANNTDAISSIDPPLLSQISHMPAKSVPTCWQIWESRKEKWRENFFIWCLVEFKRSSCKKKYLKKNFTATLTWKQLIYYGIIYTI